MSVGAQVIFHENDEHPRVLGTVTRIWPNGKYVTIVSDGRTFVRDLCGVQPVSLRQRCGDCYEFGHDECGCGECGLETCGAAAAR